MFLISTLSKAAEHVCVQDYMDTLGISLKNIRYFLKGHGHSRKWGDGVQRSEESQVIYT